MATTVFPLTDQIVTTTNWGSLNDDIDRGNNITGLSGLTGSVDTNLIKYNRPATDGPTAFDLVEKTYCTVSLDAGAAYYVSGTLVINKNADDYYEIDDQLNCGFKMGAGLSFSLVSSAGAFSGSARTTYALSGDYNTVGLDSIYAVRGTHGVSYTDQPCFWFEMVVFADQDADLEFSYAKKTDNYATTYQPPGDRSYIKAVRIF